jgi:hypothetical protein
LTPRRRPARTPALDEPETSPAQNSSRTGDLTEKLAAEHNTPSAERIAALRRPGKPGLGRAYVAGPSRFLTVGT